MRSAPSPRPARLRGPNDFARRRGPETQETSPAEQPEAPPKPHFLTTPTRRAPRGAPAVPCRPKDWLAFLVRGSCRLSRVRAPSLFPGPGQSAGGEGRRGAQGSANWALLSKTMGGGRGTPLTRHSSACSPSLPPSLRHSQDSAICGRVGVSQDFGTVGTGRPRPSFAKFEREIEYNIL